MGKKGREIVERNFCPNRFGVDVVDFLKTIIQ
jgi:hypothetical protein